ncbi:uncharacterized protein LOC143571220 [Bidens hawaiensis]|uniref:uncharacterized protein LOC143571220 n=1 Tax=Bidens hawaiensis TaxID=980011 RepID=UPI00404B92A4
MDSVSQILRISLKKTVPDNQALDVTGFVADNKDVKKFKTSKGKDTKKVNVILQDLEMNSIYLSLWDSYADSVLEHWQNRHENGVIVVVLQFGTLKYFGRFGYVNNCFNVSKLFVKYVVIVGTVRMIQEELPWYYFACKTCHKKVTKKCDGDEHPVGVLVDQEDVFDCKTETCNNTVIEVVERTPQEVSLTVFDREASKILNTSAKPLVEKHVSGGDKALYPDEFDVLAGKKFAFRIDITDFNQKNNFWVFGVSKIIDDGDIIFELKKKSNNFEVDDSACLTNCLDDSQSQDTLNPNVDNLGGIDSSQALKPMAVVEIMDDNVITPTGKQSNDKQIEKPDVCDTATFKRKSKNPSFKKNLMNTYDVVELGDMSTTKPVSDGKPTLLIPKLEK